MSAVWPLACPLRRLSDGADVHYYQHEQGFVTPSVIAAHGAVTRSSRRPARQPR